MLSERVQGTGALCVAGDYAAAPLRATAQRENAASVLHVIEIVEVDAGTNRFRKLRAFFDLARAWSATAA